jgi:hypothetical protein
LLKSLRFAFVGTKAEYEMKRKDVIMTCGDLNVRTENVYNWLRMLKQFNPKYWNISINESNNCKKIMKNLRSEVLNNVEVVDNERSKNIEKVITCDATDVRCFNKDENISSNGDVTKSIRVSSSMVHNNNNERNENV